MKVAIKYLLLFGVFVLAMFSLVEITGQIMLARSVESADSLVPLEFFRTSDDEKKWEIISKALYEGPPKGYTLTSVDIERARELVYVALTCAPEEWEGGDSVSVSSSTVRFLGEIYPGVTKQNETIHNQIPLRRLREILYNHSPKGWRVVWVGLF